MPIIKDSKADINTLKNYRPTSLLTTLSKLIERVVSEQLSKYISIDNHGDLRQYAYRTKHCVETSLLALQ